MADTLDILTEICDSPNRRAAIADVLSRHGVAYQYACYAGGTVNIEIRFGDGNPEYVYGAHYDVWPGCPGANDNGASVVCLIQLAIRLSKVGFSGPLMIVLFDKEEPCFRNQSQGGSYQLGEKLAARGVQPSMFVVLDVIGYGDTLFYAEGSSDEMADRIAGISPGLRCRQTPGSDDVLLGKAGIDSVLLCVLPEYEIDSYYPETWSFLHTKDDNTDTVKAESVEWVGQILESLTQDLIPDGAAYKVEPIDPVDPYEDLWEDYDDVPAWSDWGANV